MAIIHIDRQLQREILQRLGDAFPVGIVSHKLIPQVEHEAVVVNLAYLEGHGLVEVDWSRSYDPKDRAGRAKATSRGIDFITDDGGLTAVLGVVTVRLHEDTIKALLIERVEKSSEPDSVKAKLIKQIKTLPADALKLATTEGLKAGLNQMPDAVSWLRITLGL